MHTEHLVERVCRDFTRATGWPLRYQSPDEGRRRRSAHQETGWQVALRDGNDSAGWLRIDQPTRKSTNTDEFLKVCDLADIVAHTLGNVIASDSFESSDTLLTPASVASTQSIPATLERVLDNLLKLTGLRSAGFFLLGSDGAELKLRVDLHRDGQVIPNLTRQLSDSPLDQRALDHGVVSFRRDEGMPAEWMPDSCKLGLCAAVRSSNDPIGTLWAFDRRVRRLSPRELHVVQSVATRIGHLLEHAVLRKESVVKARLSNEMAAASGNKPSEEIDVELADGTIDLSSRCLSCSELGGDMSEIIIDGDQAVIGVGDASGHSLPATIVMSNVRGALYALASDPNASLDSDHIMARINDALYGVSQSHQFMTMVVGHLNASTKELTFTNAGHPQLIFYRDGEVDLLDSHGMLLGVMEGAEYDRSTLQLQSGDIIACYTDGISEAQDDGRRMFKPEGVADSVKRYASLSAAGIRDGIWSDVETHLCGVPCDDDRTVLVLKAN